MRGLLRNCQKNSATIGLGGSNRSEEAAATIGEKKLLRERSWWWRWSVMFVIVEVKREITNYKFLT
jgi:hypothetical protein